MSVVPELESGSTDIPLVLISIWNGAESIKRAWLAIEIKRNGTIIARTSGYTDSSGEFIFWVNPADRGYYSVKMYSVRHASYMWDTLKGMSAASYSYC